MRTIKFRGKNRQGKWLYGDLLHGDNESYILPEDALDSMNNYLAIPDTVGEFIGLIDKNGREIYEGDIIFSQKCDNRAVLHKIEYNANNAMFVAKSIQGFDFDFCQIHKFWIDKYDKEVIGNVHDNHELLNSL